MAARCRITGAVLTAVLLPHPLTVVDPTAVRCRRMVVADTATQDVRRLMVEAVDVRQAAEALAAGTPLVDSAVVVVTPRLRATTLAAADHIITAKATKAITKIQL